LIAPETVPALCLWQEAQDPSVESAARKNTDPEIELSRCVRNSVSESVPCVSAPEPFQMPLRLSGIPGASGLPQPARHSDRTMPADAKVSLGNLMEAMSSGHTLRAICE